PALGWRFALSTSSISAFPGTRDAPRWARIAGQGRDQAPMIESRNIGRTMRDFQCRARIINRLFVPWSFQAKRIPVCVRKARPKESFGSSSQQCGTKKGRRKAGLFLGTQVTRRSVPRGGRTAEPVVDARGDDINVLTDADLGHEAGRDDAAVAHAAIGLVLHEHVIVFDAGRPV